MRLRGKVSVWRFRIGGLGKAPCVMTGGVYSGFLIIATECVVLIVGDGTCPIKVTVRGGRSEGGLRRDATGISRQRAC